MTISVIFTHHVHVVRRGSRWSCHFTIVRNGQQAKHKSAGLPIWTAVSRRIARRGNDAEQQKFDFAFLAEAMAAGAPSMGRADALTYSEHP